MNLTKRLQTLAHKSGLKELPEQLRSRVERGLEQRVKLAITGLSRSGKTVFISTLAHHLLHADQGTSLPFFTPSAEGRILSVRDLSTEAETPFPLQSTLAGLQASPPHWPVSTEQLSEVRLAVKYRRPPGLGRALGEHSTLYIDLIDYPGEWLLDLPLLNLSFEQWCQQQQTLFADAPRVQVAGEFLELQRSIDWITPSSDEELARLSRLFRDLLQQLREPPHSLSLLQPGRLLMPGDLDGSPLLHLFPMLVPLPEDTEQAAPDSLYTRLKDAFERYKDEVIRPFYENHFRHFDRQIVLVDCLKTLNQGEACFNDMQQALNGLLHSFQYGRNSLLRRLFRPRINRVLFAATKADHVTANQHHNLDRFLELMIQDARREMRFDGVSTSCMALASVRSTEAVQAKLDGQVLSCLRGYRKERDEEIALFPGEIPTELPRPEDWNDARFRFIDFAPRSLPRTGLKPEHHIRLDQALEYLTGDLLK